MAVENRSRTPDSALIPAVREQRLLSLKCLRYSCELSPAEAKNKRSERFGSILDLYIAMELGRLRRLRIFGQQDKLRADRSKGRETWA